MELSFLIFFIFSYSLLVYTSTTTFWVCLDFHCSCIESIGQLRENCWALQSWGDWERGSFTRTMKGLKGPRGIWSARRPWGQRLWLTWSRGSSKQRSLGRQDEWRVRWSGGRSGGRSGGLSPVPPWALRQEWGRGACAVQSWWGLDTPTPHVLSVRAVGSHVTGHVGSCLPAAWRLGWRRDQTAWVGE